MMATRPASWPDDLDSFTEDVLLAISDLRRFSSDRAV
jgi:hypothetical protein